DATREALGLTQVQSNQTDIFLNSQYCRATQIALQQDLGSKPKMLTLEGVCPQPDGLNHNLFSQTCMVYSANKNAGNPPNVPPIVEAICTNPTANDRNRCPD